MKKTVISILLLIFLSACNIQDNIEVDIKEKNIVEVSIRNSDYNPNNILITRGTTIKWTNYDSQGHTVTIDGLFDSKTIQKGKSFSYTFSDIGSYEYYCKIHSEVKGNLLVE